MKAKETQDQNHFIHKYISFKNILNQFKNKPKKERTVNEHALVRKSCYQIQKLRSLNPDLRFLVDENLMETNIMKQIQPNVESPLLPETDKIQRTETVHGKQYDFLDSYFAHKTFLKS